MPWLSFRAPRPARLLVALSVLALVPGGRADAQGAGMEVFVGQYSPTQDLFQVTKAGAAGTYRLNSGASRGGTVALNLNQRIGVRVSGGEVESGLTFTPVNPGATSSVPARLRHGSVQAALGLTSGEQRAQPYISLGMSYAKRSGEAFEGQPDPSSYGFALGAGLRVRVSALSVSLGAEVLDYTASYAVAGKPPRDFIQRDVLLRLGAGMAVGR